MTRPAMKNYAYDPYLVSGLHACVLGRRLTCITALKYRMPGIPNAGLSSEDVKITWKWSTMRRGSSKDNSQRTDRNCPARRNRQHSFGGP